MRKLYYASGYLLMADQTCKALLRYARALAQTGESDIVTVPTINEGGSIGFAHLLIGPASQLFSAPTGDIDVDLEDARLVEILESRTRNLDPDRPEWGSDIVDVSDFATFEWDF